MLSFPADRETDEETDRQDRPGQIT